jgi:hypothetical protein
MPADTPTNPKLQKLYDAARKLAALRRKRDEALRAARGLETITAALRAERATPRTPPLPAR